MQGASPVRGRALDFERRSSLVVRSFPPLEIYRDICCRVSVGRLGDRISHYAGSICWAPWAAIYVVVFKVEILFWA